MPKVSTADLWQRMRDAVAADEDVAFSLEEARALLAARLDEKTASQERVAALQLAKRTLSRFVNGSGHATQRPVVDRIEKAIRGAP